MGTPIKIEYVPDGYIPGGIELLTLSRGKVPEPGAIEAGGVSTNKLQKDFRCGKVKLLEQGINLRNKLCSFLENIGTHGVVILEDIP